MVTRQTHLYIYSSNCRKGFARCRPYKSLLSIADAVYPRQLSDRGVFPRDETHTKIFENPNQNPEKSPQRREKMLVRRCEMNV